MAPVTFPHAIGPVTEEEQQVLHKYYKSYDRPFVRVGPENYLMPGNYQDHATAIYNLEVRPDDIWIVTFTRAGTTWMQELAWLVANNLDYETSSATPISKRYAFVEFPSLTTEKRTGLLSIPPEQRATFDDFRNMPDMTSPRFLKSHLPLSGLPPTLLDTAKVIYVARDPRDVAVSFHFAHKLFRYFDDEVQFKEFWDLFKRDLILHSPIFPHIEEAWKKRQHPNLLFVFYEEMQNDLADVIDRVCKFLGKEYTAEQKQELAERLKFSVMKKSSTIKVPNETEENEKTFFRKGKSGNWVQYFDDKMKKEAEEYVAKNLLKTDMRFPTVNI
ncbi:hypothetical protein K1T71_007442 [Dendrolimus kikuchii]|uniref:Uncharacterized protein n=1 Tax=Dendrolimus kikuchii TaxID=765133 RepID=A0ACC1D1I3_9NEOP|nr:hypothetical protein K1T71_007442 [Dendrolimus kikuchii]